MNTSESESSRPEPSGLQVELGAKPARRFRAIWLVPMLVLAVIGAGAVVWLHGQQGSPTVAWSQPSVVEFLLPNQTKTLVMTFRSNQNLSNVSVFVTPSLSSVIGATPTSFSRLVANQTYQLSLQLTAPSISEVKFDGTVQIKSAGPGSSATYAKPLPLTLVIHSQSVPPDPGDAGKATIAGIDSDGDGVRDDIQRYIVLTYLTSARAIMALSQYARVTQLFLLDGSANVALRNDQARRHRTNDCLEYVFTAARAASEASQLKAEILNTPARIRAYATSESNLGGLTYFLSDDTKLRSGCEFDPDGLPN